MKLFYEPGWTGIFTRAEAPGAYTNGTRVVKVAKDDSDIRPVGETGTVLGSMSHPDQGICYFIEWDTSLRMAVACIAWKVERLEVQ